jgi:DNA mismatch repair protein MutS
VAIKRRLTAVGELFADSVFLTRGLTEVLKGVGGQQRAGGPAVVRYGQWPDLLAWAITPPGCGDQKLLSGARSALLREIADVDPLEDLAFEIGRAVCDEPPSPSGKAASFRAGYSEEVDKLRRVRDIRRGDGPGVEQREREQTGIKKLKVGYNRVFGYYIDVPGRRGTPPSRTHYIRQTDPGEQ